MIISEKRTEPPTARWYVKSTRDITTGVVKVQPVGHCPRRMVQFFNGMPTNIVKVGESLNTHVLPKFQERPFQGFSQSGFWGGKKRDMFHFAAMATVTVQTVESKLQGEVVLFQAPGATGVWRRNQRPRRFSAFLWKISSFSSSVNYILNTSSMALAARFMGQSVAKSTLSAPCWRIIFLPSAQVIL